MKTLGLTRLFQEGRRIEYWKQRYSIVKEKWGLLESFPRQVVEGITGVGNMKIMIIALMWLRTKFLQSLALWIWPKEVPTHVFNIISEVWVALVYLSLALKGLNEIMSGFQEGNKLFEIIQDKCGNSWVRNGFRWDIVSKQKIEIELDSCENEILRKWSEGKMTAKLAREYEVKKMSNIKGKIAPR